MARAGQQTRCGVVSGSFLMDALFCSLINTRELCMSLELLWLKRRPAPVWFGFSNNDLPQITGFAAVGKILLLPLFKTLLK